MPIVQLGGSYIEISHEGVQIVPIKNTKAFLVKERPEHIDVSISILPQENYIQEIKKFKKANYFFETPNAWSIAENDNHYWFGPNANCNFEPLLPYVKANKSFTEISNYVDANEIVGSAYPLDEIMADHFFALNQGVIVHASGLNINGQGILFLGDSGAGKSTIAEFFVNEFGEKSILCDDRMIIRKIDGQWMVFGSPWHGTFNKISPNGVPLKAMYFIEQAKEHQNKNVGFAETFERLTRVSFLCWWLREYSQKQLQTIQSIVMDETIETNVLYFHKDQSIVDYLRPSII